MKPQPPENAPAGSRGVWYCVPCATDVADLHALGLGSTSLNVLGYLVLGIKYVIDFWHWLKERI